MFGQPMKCESLPMDHHHDLEQLEHERQHDKSRERKVKAFILAPDVNVAT